MWPLGSNVTSIDFEQDSLEGAVESEWQIERRMRAADGFTEADKAVSRGLRPAPARHSDDPLPANFHISEGYDRESSVASSTVAASSTYRKPLPPVPPYKNSLQKQNVQGVEVAAGSDKPEENIWAPSPIPSIQSELDPVGLETEIQRKLGQIEYLEQKKLELLGEIQTMGTYLPVHRLEQIIFQLISNIHLPEKFPLCVKLGYR